MEKKRDYGRIRFDSKALSAAMEAFKAIAPNKIAYAPLDVEFGDHTWSYDTLEEFLAAADQGMPHIQALVLANSAYKFSAHTGRSASQASVKAPAREEIESVFSVLDANAERCRLPDEANQAAKEEVKIFIGHGQDPQWRDLKDHLHERHHYTVEAYEIGSRAGHTIRDVLEEMLEKSNFALLVMTGEDEAKDGTHRARQNVVHEAGLFQGRLGFSRAIMLLENGTEEFSNIQGIQQIRFSKGNIRETFGDVLAVLRREFGG